MNVLVFVLLLLVESLVAQQGDQVTTLENSQEEPTLTIESLSTNVSSTTPTTPPAENEMGPCDHCLRQYPDCKTSLDCDPCMIPCKVTHENRTEVAEPTTEDLLLPQDRLNCQKCLGEHRECTSLLNCTVCHIPCQIFEEYAKPTPKAEFTQGLESFNECEQCLRNHTECKSVLKCDPCKTICEVAERDIQESIRAASRCKICKEAPRCRKYGKCDSCKKYCEHDEEKPQTMTTEPIRLMETTTEIRERSSHILNLMSSRRKAGVARLTHRTRPKILHEVERDVHEGSGDVLGAAAPIQEICNPIIVSPVVAGSSDMKGANLSHTAARFYVLGAFRPGPRMNHLLHILNVRRTEDIAKVVVIAKLKSNRGAANEPPVIIDYNNLFTSMDTQSTGPGNRIDGPSIDLTSEIDKELHMAGEQKQTSKGESSLTPEEVFKVIEHATSLHKMREEGQKAMVAQTPSSPRAEDTFEETTVPLLAATESNNVFQTRPIPVTDIIRGRLAKPTVIKKSQAVRVTPPELPSNDLMDVLRFSASPERMDADQERPQPKPQPEALSSPEGVHRISQQDGYIEEILPQSKSDGSTIVAQEPPQQDSDMELRRKGVESSSLVEETSSITPLEVKIKKVFDKAHRVRPSSEVGTTTGSTFESGSMDERVRSTEIEEEPDMGPRIAEATTITSESTVGHESARSSESEGRQPESEMMEDIRKTIEERRKKLEESTIVGKQRVDSALNKLQEMLNKERKSEDDEEEGVVGVEQESTTVQADTATITVGEQDRKDLVEKFTGVIADDLAGRHNLTKAKKEEIEEEVSKLVKSTVEGESQQRATEQIDNLDRDLTKIERLVEAADEKPKKMKPSKGVYTKKGHLKKVVMKPSKPRKDDEQVGQPAIIEADNAVESAITTPKKFLVPAKSPIEAETRPAFAKSLIKDVTDVPEYLMKKFQKLVDKIPGHTHRFKIPGDSIVGSEQQDEGETSTTQETQETSTVTEVVTETTTPKKQTEMDWNLYTTSTSSPTAPWIFPEYEGTTLSIYHGRQSEDSDSKVGKALDWAAKDEHSDSFETFNTFGKIVPAKDSSKVIQHKSSSDMSMVQDAYFFGDMELPLRMKYYSDGTIKLAVDKKKYCKCSDSHCISHDQSTPESHEAEVMQLDEADNWEKKSDDDSSFEDVALGMSAPTIINRNADPDTEAEAAQSVSMEPIEMKAEMNASSSDNVRVQSADRRPVKARPVQSEESTEVNNENSNFMSNVSEEPKPREPTKSKVEMRDNTERKNPGHSMSDIEPANENVDREENRQVKRQSAVVKKLRERKNKLLAKMERKKSVFKRSPLMLGSNENICSGSECDSKFERTQTKRHLDRKDEVQERVGLVTDLISLMKNVAADKKM